MYFKLTYHLATLIFKIKSSSNQVSGLCGVYNLNQLDDFTLPNKVTSLNVAEFGNSWKTGVTCDDDIANTGMAVDACVLATHYQEYATGVCEVCWRV